MNAKDLMIETWQDQIVDEVPIIPTPHDWLAHQVIQDLRSLGARLAVAESCTGGILASRLTSISGSSQVFDCGVICYSNHAKSNIVGVHQEVIEGAGAVSQRVAVDLAKGICDISRADIGIGITGIAGPDGGREGKPVGLVYIGFYTEHDRRSWHHKHHFLGIRSIVQQNAAKAALQHLMTWIGNELTDREEG